MERGRRGFPPMGADEDSEPGTLSCLSAEISVDLCLSAFYSGRPSRFEPASEL